METREARIRLLIETANVSAATPGTPAAPGVPPSPSSAVPGVPAGAPGANPVAPAWTPPPTVPGSAPGFTPPYPPPIAPDGGQSAAPGASPAYVPGRLPDATPTTTSERGESASRKALTLSAAARGAGNVAGAALGGGSLTSSLIALPGIIPIAGAEIASKLKAGYEAVQIAEKYGPFAVGLLKGAAKEVGMESLAGVADEVQSYLETGLNFVSGGIASIDSVSAGVRGVQSLAATQGRLNRGRVLDTAQRNAQAAALGVTFEAERLIAEREAVRQRAITRMGNTFAGEQLGAVGINALLQAGLVSGVRR